MKHSKTWGEIERDERDVEDMRKDNAPIIEPRGAKKGHEVRDWAHSTKIIDPGASPESSQAEKTGITEVADV